MLKKYNRSGLLTTNERFIDTLVRLIKTVNETDDNDKRSASSDLIFNYYDDLNVGIKDSADYIIGGLDFEYNYSLSNIHKGSHIIRFEVLAKDTKVLVHSFEIDISEMLLSAENFAFPELKFVLKDSILQKRSVVSMEVFLYMSLKNEMNSDVIKKHIGVDHERHN